MTKLHSVNLDKEETPVISLLNACTDKSCYLNRWHVNEIKLNSFPFGIVVLKPKLEIVFS